MQAVASLSVPVLEAIHMNIFSPSKHPFMKRVQQTRFSFDPYKTVRSAVVVRSPLRADVVAAAPVVAAPVLAAAPKPTINSNTPRFALIAFKKGSALFRAPFRIVVGDLVVVEGDRGEHIGVVKSIGTDVPTEPVSVKILRRASAADREAYEVKVEKEKIATEEISKIAGDVRLNATVVDVEYQFDMNKLTIFVERAAATTFVDFRKLQRTLFRQFHCRIWCAYMDEVKA